MKAALISLGSKSSVMTYEAMQKYFESVDMIELKRIEVRLGKEAAILYDGKELGHYDCVYVKGSYKYANLLCSLASMLEGKVAYMPFFANAFTTVHNKLLTHLVLQQHKIPMPRTYITSTIAAAKDLLKRVNYPVVMKFPEGTQGKGVMFADSYSSASSLLDALGVLNQPFIIQEYVETGGSDIRALVVGDKVVAAMRRKAQTEEKRANIHAGGVGQSVQLSRELVKLAVTTARVLGADICGVDILESPLGPLVIEANISPGLQGLGKVSPVDLPDEIAKFLFFKTQEKVEERKKQGAVEVMKELDLDPEATQEIVSTLQFRGEKIILPEIANKIARFNETKEYIITAKKGRLEIQETR
ncbi:RimK family alpha-L-glutamate ligase [Candidatus Woesearchaeota archaeon]|nr:RimK family alpha-L-glutamate ligase [Candidatus Woesearchaeota archaeon]